MRGGRLNFKPKKSRGKALAGPVIRLVDGSFIQSSITTSDQRASARALVEFAVASSPEITRCAAVVANCPHCAVSKRMICPHCGTKLRNKKGGPRIAQPARFQNPVST